ncbi:hypothetical protein evm_015113 [Chilo suppressalis]|nr:hypothetical protein evm_015113 [Chilo suppressalis]
MTFSGFVDEAGSPVDSSTDSTTPAAVPVDIMSPTPISPAPIPASPENAVPISLSTISAAPPNSADDNTKYPCEISASKVSVPGFVCKGQLLFEDNFNSNLEKGKVWTTEIMFPGEPDFPFNVYLNDRNLRVRNGMLKIRPVTLESKYGEDYVTQSLDLTSRSTHLKEKIGYEQWANHFHIYSLEWRPDGISLSVDGEKYGEVNPGSGFLRRREEAKRNGCLQWLKGTIMAPFDQMFYISIGLNVGGLHEFPDSTTKPWKDRATKAMLNFWTAKEQWFPTWSMCCNCDKDDDVCGLL